MKKYKLNLPENIGMKDSQWQFLKLMDDKIVKLESCQGHYRLVSQVNYDYPVFKVFEDWLEEIPEEPKVLSAEEWVKKKYWEKEPKEWVFTQVDMEYAYSNGFSIGKQQGRIKEYYKPEQVELREAVLGNTEYDELERLVRNLKPPVTK